MIDGEEMTITVGEEEEEEEEAGVQKEEDALKEGT